MPCRQSPTFAGDVGIGKPDGTGFDTQAECNEKCAEGACCEGTVCSIKPACGCCGEFKGSGTTCEGGPCNPLP